MGVFSWSKTKSEFEDDEVTGKKRRFVSLRTPEEVRTVLRPDLSLIDRATFLRIQAKLDEYGKGTLRDANGKLAGRAPGSRPHNAYRNAWHVLLWCGECGGPFAVNCTHVKTGRRFLTCLHRYRFANPTCTNRGTLRLDVLDEALKDALVGYFSDAKLAEQRFRRMLNALNNERKKISKEERAARTALEQVRLRKERIQSAILDGARGPTTAAMMNAAEADEQRVLDELSRLEAAPRA
jgi:hypothetical protein